MKIIDIAICTDNKDPKGLGRIRCVRYNEYNVGEKDKRKFTEWGDDDPYLANPFLPYTINLIPEIKQAVKLINYNPIKENINVEYIAGPFTNIFDSENQTFTQQLKYTTYGTPDKENVNMYDVNGNYVDPKSKHAFAKPQDTSIYGKYGSDIIFSENGIQMRAGKYKSKEAATKTERQKLLNYPVVSKKMSNIYLKKFDKTMVLDEQEVEVLETSVTDLNYIVEYEHTPTKIDFYVYKILKNRGDVARTNVFNVSSPLPVEKKLINIENDDITPTYSILTTSTNGKEIAQEIRNVIYTLHTESLNKLNTLYKNDDLHPFHFRPTLNYSTKILTNQTEMNLRFDILTNVIVYHLLKSGLIWSRLEISAPTKKTLKKEQTVKRVDNSPEQTFSALMSDNIFLMSTNTNIADKSINFTDIDTYSLSQDDYVKRISPNTYSLVRGENLIKLLEAIITVLKTHVHNPAEPLVQNGYDDLYNLNELILSMKNDILNNAIRIN